MSYVTSQYFVILLHLVFLMKKYSQMKSKVSVKYNVVMHHLIDSQK